MRRVDAGEESALVQQLRPRFLKSPGKFCSGVIPYRAVYDSQEEARKRGYWLPGIPIRVKIKTPNKKEDEDFHLISVFM